MKTKVKDYFATWHVFQTVFQHTKCIAIIGHFVILTSCRTVSEKVFHSLINATLENIFSTSFWSSFVYWNEGTDYRNVSNLVVSMFCLVSIYCYVERVLNIHISHNSVNILVFSGLLLLTLLRHCPWTPPRHYCGFLDPMLWWDTSHSCSAASAASAIGHSSLQTLNTP